MLGVAGCYILEETVYISEKSFSAAFVKKLKKGGADYYRVETGGTCCGFPDIYATLKGLDCFVELKNDSKARLEDYYLKVDWRPGQQAFARKYIFNTKVHHGELHYYKYTWTFVAVANGVIAIRMDDFYHDRKVPVQAAVNVWRFGIREWRELDLPHFLRWNTCVCNVQIKKEDTIETYKERFANMYASVLPMSVDAVHDYIANYYVNLATTNGYDLSRWLCKFIYRKVVETQH